MQSRIDVPSILLVIGLVLVLLDLFHPERVPFVSPGDILLLGVTVAIFLFASYWGLTLGRRMASSLYRNQAFSLGVVVLAALLIEYVGNVASTTVLSNFPFFSSNANFELRIDVFFILVFFWVDSSILASEGLDPMSRDTLHWRKARYAFWGVVLLGTSIVGLTIASGNYAFYDNPPVAWWSTVVQILSSAPFLLTIIVGVILLPLGGLRSSDHNFRKQLQWFALGLLFPFVISLLDLLVPNNSVLQNDSYSVVFLLIGYCYYRSARALVPLNRISMELQRIPKTTRGFAQSKA